MKILIDPHAGFCPGVAQAVHRVETVLAAEGRATVLGSLIHNPREVERLQKLGLNTESQALINHPAQLAARSDQPIFIRTHGLAADAFRDLQTGAARIEDATCSVVRRVQKMVAEQSSQGRRIVIIGKKGHAEVIGLAGHAAESVVVQDETDLDPERLQGPLAVFCQTTVDRIKFLYLAEKIKSLHPDTLVFDTTCRYINRRREVVTAFAATVDVFLLVGGADSSNSQILFTACRSVNARSYKIETVQEIDSTWFLPTDTVGISGGASTPLWQLEEIRNHLLGPQAQ